MPQPRLSVILLTWNEAANIGPCLASLSKQDNKDFEVLVIDAASTDGTTSIVRAAQEGFPVPIRLDVADRRIPIGEARNRGVKAAAAPLIAFLSADAEVEHDWVSQVLASLRGHDMVFGKQVHDPHTWSIGAAVRGLRYHFPDHEAADPIRYASNVAAGYRAEVLRDFPFDAWANAAEDILLAKRSTEAGYTIVYNPAMVVRHHDVATVRQEMTKCIREGDGCARYARELGVMLPVVAWAGLLGAAARLGARRPFLGASAFRAALFLPAVRRTFRPHVNMPPEIKAMAVAASPPFDLAFLFAYSKGLLGALQGADQPPTATHQEKQT